MGPELHVLDRVGAVGERPQDRIHARGVDVVAHRNDALAPATPCQARGEAGRCGPWCWVWNGSGRGRSRGRPVRDGWGRPAGAPATPSSSRSIASFWGPVNITTGAQPMTMAIGIFSRRL